MRDWRYNPRVRRAAEVVRGGGVVAYPTEGVWGLGCDPANADAVQRILQLKRRPVSKGVILIAADISMLEPFLRGIDAAQRAQLARSWPGAVTWLIPNNGAAANWITGDSDRLAVRVTAHPLAAALCKAFGGPLVSTSANPGGFPAAASLIKVKAYFGANLDDYLPGKVGHSGRPSEIRDLLSGRVIRPGAGQA